MMCGRHCRADARHRQERQRRDPTIDDTRRAVPGEVLTYSLDVTNTGSSAAYDVTVSDLATDTSWVFADTTTALGVTNTDAIPAGGLAWTIDGPITPTETVTISYTLTVPAGFDETDETPRLRAGEHGRHPVVLRCRGPHGQPDPDTA